MQGFDIFGIGTYVPEKVLTNEEIESWGIGASAKWIYENTGVKERRIATSEQSCSDLAALAAKEAISKANLLPDEIDLMVMTTSLPDLLSPHTSSILRKKAGLNNAVCFDILAGCAGFMYALITGVSYAIANEEINNLLIVGSDTFSKVTDWTDRKSCSISGDGAGALVLSRTKGSYGIKCSYICHEDMEDINCAWIPIYYGEIQPNSSTYYRFNGKYLYNVLKRNIPQVINKLLEKANWDINEVKLFVFPQVNKNLILDIASLLNIPLEKTHMVMHKYGYTYSSCVPITLHDALSCNKLCIGDKVVLLGSGSGNYFAGVALEWGILT